MTHFRFAQRVFFAGALLLGAVSAQAVTINFSSLEQVLADPDDTNSKMSALWTGWATQLYEYNMPFIEIENDSAFAVERFTMTIGDENYQFSNEFLRKEDTNSYPFPADGSWAIGGYSTPDIEFTSSIADNGDQLVVDFGDGGLQPGEVVRFQVDIDRDPPGDGMMMFADYTSVFFQPSGDDTSSNSMLSFEFDGIAQPSTLRLPNLGVSGNVAQFLQNPRPYNVMQMIDVYPGTTLDVIPEPTTAVLTLLAAAGIVGRRVG